MNPRDASTLEAIRFKTRIILNNYDNTPLFKIVMQRHVTDRANEFIDRFYAPQQSTDLFNTIMRDVYGIVSSVEMDVAS